MSLLARRGSVSSPLDASHHYLDWVSSFMLENGKANEGVAFRLGKEARAEVSCS